MPAKKKTLPWDWMQEFRTDDIRGEWPTFQELLRIQSKRFGDRACFTDFYGPSGGRQTLTYAEVFDKVRQVARWLIENGIRKGDKVAVSGKNSPQWAVAYLSVLYASAVVIPIDNGLHEAEVCNIINRSEPRLAFADDEKCEYLRKNFPAMPVFSLNDTEPEKYIYNLNAKTAADDFKWNPDASEDELAAILFTSGTTGIPKGVMLSHKNLICDGYIAQTNLTIYHTDVFYALLPLHHAYTMQAAFICPLEVGAEIVFGRSMAVSRLMKELDEGKISVMLGVPLLYNKLLNGINKGIREKGALMSGLMSFLRGLSYILKKITGRNLGKGLFKAVLKKANIYTLRVAICGGGPLAKSVFKQYNAMGIDFIQGYGLTEASPIIALNPKEAFKIESVGRDFSPYEEIKIINKNEDGIGEICVKGPMLMQGYYKMPQETADSYTADGFYKTGDLGWMDKDNYIMLCGRSKNIIVTSGGKNVYPEELEDMFQLYTDIQQITIQGYYREDDQTSEEIEALVYPSDELLARLGTTRETADTKTVTAEVQKIISAVNKRLQPYEQITRLMILEKPLEMTTTMKVKRNYKNE